MSSFGGKTDIINKLKLLNPCKTLGASQLKPGVSNKQRLCDMFQSNKPLNNCKNMFEEKKNVFFCIVLAL